MARTTTTTGEVGRHLRQLFDAGSAVGLGDGELLDRFAAAGDDAGRRESAFEAIVARHGSTVLSVCRQVLGDNHAAEDAFQATFLVLVRRSRSLRIRAGGSLGSWLHGVAYRTALKARKQTMRRRARESRVSRPEARAG
ncbi:MAG: RNA polymerase sigma factor, partial [Isosphaeraceae bacterium]